MRTTPTLLLTLTITFLLINSSCALFGRKKKNKNKLAKEQPVSVSLVSDSTAANDAAAATNSVTAVVTIGEYLEKYMNIKSTSSLNSIIINIIIMIFTAVVGHLFLVLIQYKSNNKSNKANKKVDVVLVGMGLPKKGMGWYHLTQLLSDARLAPYVNVVSVVEPFFMNPKLCVNVPTAFSEYVDMTSNQYGVSFVKSIDEVPDLSKSEYSLCLIAGRTGDNPRLFRECVAKGAKVIYLEKPGASSVQELQEMKDLADFNGVQVYLGYNKNVTPYVQKAISLASSTPNSHVLFRHNNSYKLSELSECFARNSEGMLKNMAIHELALLVSFFDITLDTIQSFSIDKDISEKLILNVKEFLPNTFTLTDFSKILFTVKNQEGSSVSIMADRCGGNVSYAAVLNGEGQEFGKFEFPNAQEQDHINKLIASDPDMMPYFFVQSDDYLELKSRVVHGILKNETPESVATIGVGIEALKLAEFGTQQLMKEL